jgi:hypothetical protein
VSVTHVIIDPRTVRGTRVRGAQLSASVDGENWTTVLTTVPSSAPADGLTPSAFGIPASQQAEYRYFRWTKAACSNVAEIELYGSFPEDSTPLPGRLRALLDQAA